LVKSQSVQERGEDGNIWIRSVSWYAIKRAIEKVKGYKMMNYLEFKAKK